MPRTEPIPQPKGDPFIGNLRAIDGEGFQPAGNKLFDILQEICGEIRKTPMRRPT